LWASVLSGGGVETASHGARRFGTSRLRTVIADIGTLGHWRLAVGRQTQPTTSRTTATSATSALTAPCQVRPPPNQTARLKLRFSAGRHPHNPASPLCQVPANQWWGCALLWTKAGRRKSLLPETRIHERKQEYGRDIGVMINSPRDMEYRIQH
jgi:hypothetical protein